MKGKVKSCTLVSEWEFNGTKNYTFAVRFEGDDKAYGYVGKDKDNPKFKVGEEAEYEDAGKTVKFQVEGKWHEIPKISLAKKPFNGGGSGKPAWQPKTKEQYDNDIVGYVGGYAKDLLIARQDIAKGDVNGIIKEYATLTKGMYEALTSLTK